MYDGKKVLCIILARGGSKGISRKNVRLLAGKPLIVHSIDAARQAMYIDEIYVSTDDAEIKEISAGAGAKIVDRPVELATDTAIYLDAAKHLFKSIGADPSSIIVGLEPTSPIRTPADIEGCIELFEDQIDCVVTITEARNHPAHLLRLRDQMLIPFDDSIKRTNRQQMEKIYVYTGSVFVATVEFLQNQKIYIFGKKMRGYILDQRKSIDIDTPLDFEICEFIMGRSDKNPSGADRLDR